MSFAAGFIFVANFMRFAIPSLSLSAVSRAGPVLEMLPKFVKRHCSLGLLGHAAIAICVGAHEAVAELGIGLEGRTRWIPTKSVNVIPMP